MLLPICNRRLRGGLAEDEGRGQAARVPADGDPADLDPRCVKAGDRPSVPLAEYLAARVYGEPTHRVGYGRRDLYGHKGRNAQGHGRTGPRWGMILSRGDGLVVAL